jgi:hypothetical protein
MGPDILPRQVPARLEELSIDFDGRLAQPAISIAKRTLASRACVVKRAA